jgi:hypothetical protein
MTIKRSINFFIHVVGDRSTLRHVNNFSIGQEGKRINRKFNMFNFLDKMLLKQRCGRKNAPNFIKLW